VDFHPQSSIQEQIILKTGKRGDSIGSPSFLSCGRLSLFENRQYFFGVAVRLDLGKDASDLAGSINHEGSALNPHYLSAIHILLFDDAESVTDLLVGIGQQCVRQVIFLFEFLLCLGTIGGDAEDPCPGLLNLLKCVAEPARFYGSTRGISLRKEEQDDGFPFKIFKCDLLAFFVGKDKIRSLVVYFHAFGSPVLSESSFISQSKLCRHARRRCHSASADSLNSDTGRGPHS
jgi:hypothetical protein